MNVANFRGYLTAARRGGNAGRSRRIATGCTAGRHLSVDEIWLGVMTGAGAARGFSSGPVVEDDTQRLLDFVGLWSNFKYEDLWKASIIGDSVTDQPTYITSLRLCNPGSLSSPPLPIVIARTLCKSHSILKTEPVT
jgi:hypothetical protein